MEPSWSGLWGFLEHVGSHLEPSSAILSHLGGHLGASGALLEPSWAILGALTTREWAPKPLGGRVGVSETACGLCVAGPISLPASHGPGRGGRERSERPRWPKMAPRGPPMLQDGLQDGSRQCKIAQDELHHAPKRPQEGHKTVAGALGDPSGPPRDAKILQKLQGN